ncbi:MAG: FAD-dependent monooxygenase [Hyphomicrobiales bacterium]|nr:FAD-dependent monooxygenase [Hyphomicrobiales bacterium]
MQDSAYDVAIAGGSFVGLTLAIALSRASNGAVTVAVIDKAGRDAQLGAGFDGRSAAIAAAAKRMFETLEIWPAVAADAQPIRAIEITDTELDMPIRTALLRFNTELREDLAAAYVLENVKLRRALFEAAEAAPGVSLIMPASVGSFSADDAGVSLALTDGRLLRARLLVAADGQKSALRAMAGIKTVEWAAERMGLVACVAHEGEHDGRAVQHFLPSGPFAMLPLTGRRTSLVWTERMTEARRLLALGAPAFTEEVERRFGRHLGPLTIISKPSGYPLSMTLARGFVKPRFALAGDSAHALHWIAGQGLNHGLKDAAALAEVVMDAARLGMDIGAIETLQRYERWRRFDSATGALAAAAINRLFSDGGAPLRALRSLGLSVVERAGPVKEFFMREAAGLTGSPPRLLRGEQL